MEKIKVIDNATGDIFEFDNIYNALAFQEKCVFVYGFDVEVLNSGKVR